MFLKPHRLLLVLFFLLGACSSDQTSSGVSQEGAAETEVAEQFQEDQSAATGFADCFEQESGVALVPVTIGEEVVAFTLPAGHGADHPTLSEANGACVEIDPTSDLSFLIEEHFANSAQAPAGEDSPELASEAQVDGQPGADLANASAEISEEATGDVAVPLDEPGDFAFEAWACIDQITEVDQERVYEIDLWLQSDRDEQALSDLGLSPSDEQVVKECAV